MVQWRTVPDAAERYRTPQEKDKGKDKGEVKKKVKRKNLFLPFF